MSSEGISGWQTAMIALPDLASPKSTTTSAEKKTELEQRQIAPVKPTGNAVHKKVDDAKGFADNNEDTDKEDTIKEDTKKEIVTVTDPTEIVEKRQTSQSPTRATDDKTLLKDVKEEEKAAAPKKRTSIGKRKVDELSTDMVADKAEADDEAKDKEKGEIAPAKRTRSVSGQTDADRTETSEGNEGDREKTVPIPEAETRRVKPRLTSAIEETTVYKGKGKEKATIPDETRLRDGKISGEEKKPNKKAATKKKAPTPGKTKLGDKEISDVEKTPKRKAAAPRVSKPSKPPTYRHYTRSGKDRGSMDYANKLNSMTNMLRRRYR